MIGNYLRVTEDDLDELLAVPESISAFLYPEDDSEPPPGRHLDVDKAWHLIHFLLTGDAWEGPTPLVYAVLGGYAIGEEDVGYGPARYIMPSQVTMVAGALAEISPEVLWTRFDRRKATEAEIYPHEWEGNDEERVYVLDYYVQLQAFFAEAAREHDAMVMYLN